MFKVDGFVYKCPVYKKSPLNHEEIYELSIKRLDFKRILPSGND